MRNIVLNYQILGINIDELEIFFKSSKEMMNHQNTIKIMF